VDQELFPLASPTAITNKKIKKSNPSSLLPMASESHSKLSPLPYPLHCDLRETDPMTPILLEAPARAESAASTSTSPLDGHLVAHPLHLDLYNPMAPSNNHKSRQSESKSTSSKLVVPDVDKRARFNRQQQHQKQSSTASLAEFLKSTGPEDIRRGSVSGMVRPESPTSNRKKNPGSFLLKFAVGKSTTTTKREDISDISSVTKSTENSVPPLAHPQVTAAGRKYYAIKVDYPYSDDSSMSSRPLLTESPLDPKDDTRSEMDYHAIMAVKKHHRLSSVLGSDTSMEFLNDKNKNPRGSGPYSSYPPSHNRNSIARSSSMSEMISPRESFRDDGSILPGDSISLRPAQVTRSRVHTAPGVVQSITTSPPTSRQPPQSGRRSRSSSYGTTIQDGGAEQQRALAASPIPPPSQTSSGTLELMDSLEMLDNLRKSKTPSDTSSIASHATAKSLQQRRRAKRLGQQSASVDSTNRDITKRPIYSSRSIPNLNNKGLPLLPPHMNSTANPVQRERAATIAAALSARSKKQSPEPTSPVSSRAFSPLPFSSSTVSLENYSIPEDDVLSLRSGISTYRSQRREKVRDKRQKDLDEERSKKLDEAMRLLQKDVQRKRDALDRDEQQESGSTGSQTPRQMPSMDHLRASPITPPPTSPIRLYAVSPISTVVDCPPTGPRRRPSTNRIHSKSPVPERSDSDSRPKTSNSQRTIFTNGPITPASSPPSSPTRSQYQNLVKQAIPQFVSLPPNYPPPNPTPPLVARPVSTPLSPPADEDRELRIAALEEQKWVLEQALRVLLNQQPGKNTPSTSPHLGYLERSPPKAL
jgi:hypothetical protein